jgi:thiol:disulfide interchange protein
LNKQKRLRIASIISIILCCIVMISCRPQKKTMASSSNSETTYSGNIWRFRGTIEIEYNPTYTGLFQKAFKKRRPIFLAFYTDWCTTCPFLNEGMIKKRPIINLLEENFVSYLIDAERSDGYKLASEYNIAAYPTILYLNSEGVEISRYVGVPDEHKVIQYAKSAIQAEKKFQNEKQKK